jgi:hypothetical protein
MMITKHAYRCGAYLAVLADPIPGEQLADVDVRVNAAVRDGALACTCYVGREWAEVHHPSCPARHGEGMCLGCGTAVEGGAVDLDETDEEVPVEDDGPEYEYACIGSIVCEPLVDSHGRECERVNQEARVDFYEEVAASRFGATAWTGLGR